MKDRGKAVVYEFETRCKKHPCSSSVGICPLCLKERLLKLLIEDQRNSSCFDVSSSYRNSCSVIEVGNLDIREEKSKQVPILSRSNSSRIRGSDSTSLWRLFGKKNEFFEKLRDDQKGISRCRSVCRYDLRDTEILDEVTEKDDVGMVDESEFIDLELDVMADRKKKGSSLDHGSKFRKAESFSVNSSSDVKTCRIAVNDKELKRSRKSRNVLKWIFKYHSTSK